MPGLVRPVTDEREALLAFLAQQRDSVRVSAYGLTDEQARTAGSVSELTIAGLVKHLTAVELSWMDTVLEQESAAKGDDYGSNFQVAADESVRELLERYDDAAKRTESVVAAIEDLGRPVPVPQGVPWFPPDVEAWSVRWVLLHLIEETSKHAGHADIVRESIDGATFYPLMAAAEGWPASPYLQPWEPTG